MTSSEGFHIEEIPPYNPGQSLESYARRTVFEGSTPDYTLTAKMSLSGKLTQVEIGYGVFETEDRRQLEEQFAELLSLMIRSSRSAMRIAAYENRK